MITITCDCGNNVQLDYTTATLVSLPAPEPSMDLVEYYYFTCAQCGQQYRKPVPLVKEI